MLCTAPRSVGYRFGFLQFDELSVMTPYTCMKLIFYSTPAIFFCDATMGQIIIIQQEIAIV